MIRASINWSSKSVKQVAVITLQALSHLLITELHRCFTKKQLQETHNYRVVFLKTLPSLITLLTTLEYPQHTVVRFYIYEKDLKVRYSHNLRNIVIFSYVSLEVVLSISGLDACFYHERVTS